MASAYEVTPLSSPDSFLRFTPFLFFDSFLLAINNAIYPPIHNQSSIHTVIDSRFTRYILDTTTIFASARTLTLLYLDISLLSLTFTHLHLFSPFLSVYGTLAALFSLFLVSSLCGNTCCSPFFS